VCRIGSKCVYKYGYKKNLTDWDIAELVLESDSDARSSEDEDISAQSDSDPGDNTDANFKQWTNNMNCPTVPVAH
jgi:hypothetical protein